MFTKTYSQKVARIFEIVGYILLLPAILSIIYPFFLLLASFASGQMQVVLLCSVPFILFGLGTVLLVGYCRHSRGLLNEEKVLPLWIGTFLFNLLFAIPAVFGLFSQIKDMSSAAVTEAFNPFALIGLLIVSWWVIALGLSVSAAVKHLEGQKYL